MTKLPALTLDEQITRCKANIAYFEALWGDDLTPAQLNITLVQMVSIKDNLKILHEQLELLEGLKNGQA